MGIKVINLYFKSLLLVFSILVDTDLSSIQLIQCTCMYVYFSGHDYTATYGATQFDGNLTPRIHRRLKGVKNCILDGEMCGYDQELQVLGMGAIDIRT